MKTKYFGLVLETTKKISNNLSNKEIEKILLKNNKDLVKNWREKDLPQIFKTAGKNIKKPFPKTKKTTNNWKKLRKYNVNINNFSQGIWTGATYYALEKGKSVKDRNYKEIVEPYKVKIELTGNKYLNYTIGISEKLFNDYKLKVNKEIIKGIFNGVK